MAKKYISLRGKFSLAPIVEGVVGAMRELGNIPDFTLEITADKINIPSQCQVMIRPI